MSWPEAEGYPSPGLGYSPRLSSEQTDKLKLSPFRRNSYVVGKYTRSVRSGKFANFFL